MNKVFKFAKIVIIITTIIILLISVVKLLEMSITGFIFPDIIIKITIAVISMVVIISGIGEVVEEII